MHRLAFLMLWVFVFTVPWQNSLSLEAVGTVSQLVGILAFLVAILRCVSSGQLRRPTRMLLLVGAFGMYALLSAGWSPDPNTTLVKALTIFELVAMFWLITEVVSDDGQICGLLCAYVAGSAISVIATFARFAAGTANQDLRYTAAGFNPNDAALTLALAIPMACFLISPYARAVDETSLTGIRDCRPSRDCVERITHRRACLLCCVWHVGTRFAPITLVQALDAGCGACSLRLVLGRVRARDVLDTNLNNFGAS